VTHVEIRTALLEESGHREDVWGADWIPERKEVRCAALINIRPRVNPSMEIQDPGIRQQVEQIVRSLLQRS